MIKIKKAGVGDASLFAKMEAEIFSDPWNIKALEGHFSTPSGIGYLCFQGEEPAGYLLASVGFGEGEIFRVGTLPSHRRKGIGRALLLRFLEDGRCGEASLFFLEVRESNIGARALYESLGFVKTGERKNYYTNPREGAVLYQMDPTKKDQI